MAIYKYVTDKGVVIPDTSDLIQDVQQEFKAALGADLNTDPSTPQGVLITMEVESRDAVVRNNAELANQINPDHAGGIWLDGIFSLMSGSRRGATRSVIPQVRFSGVPTTIIPAGSLAVVSATGKQFKTTSSVIIAANGDAFADVVSVDLGPVECGVNELDTIASSVLGWERVSNNYAVILGRFEESDNAARRRRVDVLGVQNTSQTEAIMAGIMNIDTVRSMSFRENVEDVTKTIDGIVMKPHSIYMCIEGGTNDEITRSLWRTKTVGAGYNGNISHVQKDPWSGQDYEIKYDRPKERAMLIRVTVKPSTLNVTQIIPNAIMDFSNGDLETGRGFMIGSDVSPFEISAAINEVEPTIFVKNVEISESGGTNWTSATVPVALDEVARVSRSSITVLIA